MNNSNSLNALISKNVVNSLTKLTKTTDGNNGKCKISTLWKEEYENLSDNCEIVYND